MMGKQPNGRAEREAMLPGVLEVELRRNLEASGIARAAVAGRCSDFELDASVCQTLMLLVSEVVSNAVIHSRAPAEAPILLTATMTTDAVRITVTDAGDGFTPEPRKPIATQGGYGLYLLDKAAARWGVDRMGGTRVWFELPRAGS